MAKKEKYFIENGNEENDDDVFLSDLHVKMILLLAEGGEQKIIAHKVFKGDYTAHNIINILYALTGAHNQQGLVGWAFRLKVLLAENRKIFVNPNLPKKMQPRL